MDELFEAIRAEIAQAAAQEMPVYTQNQWLVALQQLVSDRMAPGMGDQLTHFVPDLERLAQSAHFELGAEGVMIVARGPDQVTLTRLRRGSLWFRGGDVESELLALLDEPRS